MERFEAMQTFVRVVEAGSFSAAAERMAVAKSVVSRRVQELEAHLGVRLLNRTTRRLSLTESGRHYYERVLRIIAEVEETELAITSEQAELRGELRLAVPLSFGLLHLMPLLNDFIAEHPVLLLDLNLSDRQLNLIEEGVDLAIRIGRLADSTLVARRLAPVRFVVCASPDYLQRFGEPHTPDELVDHQGLLYSNIPEGVQWSFSAGGRNRSVKVPTRLRSNNGDALLQAAINGLGITVMPSFLGYNALAQGLLRPVLTDYPVPSEAIYAIYPSQRYLPRRVRALVDLLVDRFGEQPYWDEW
jgi:DNA-binding transcriptional LysR family regulator